MTIATHDHPAIAATKADMVYDASDATLGISITAFLNITRAWQEPDRSVGYPGGWEVEAKLIGAQIGDLVLGADAADHALDGFVKHIERQAAEAERDRLNEEGAAA